MKTPPEDTDSTTHFRRRNRHLQTTIAGWLFPLSLALRYVHGLRDVAEFLEAFAGLLLGTAAADAGREKVRGVIGALKRTAGIGKSTPTATLPLLAILALVSAAGAGCSTFRSTQTETDTDRNFVRETTIEARTFFNARSDLAKMRATTTDKTQGMTIGALGMTADGSNVTHMIEAVVGAAVKAAARGP